MIPNTLTGLYVSLKNKTPIIPVNKLINTLLTVTSFDRLFSLKSRNHKKRTEYDKTLATKTLVLPYVAFRRS